MQDLDLDSDLIRYAGLQDREPNGTALGLYRMPRWARAQIVDPFLQLIIAMPSGAKLELDTDSTSLELEVSLTMIRLADNPVFPATFDLTVDGELVGSVGSIEGLVIAAKADGTVEYIPGPQSATIRFEDLPPGQKRLEVWLPNAATVALHAVRVDDGATVSAPAPDGRRRWVHYGSSISHCLEADHPTGVWPVVAARRADVQLDSLGLGGQAQLDQFAARTIRDLPADLISLKIGINIVNADSMRERTFVPAVHGFLDTIRDGHPTTPIVLLTPILCPTHEDAPGPTVSVGGAITSFDRPVELAFGALSIGSIRRLLADIVASRRALGDTNLHLMDGRSLFGEDDLDDLPDGLHPNAAGYRRMGERFHALAFEDGGVFAP